MTQIREVRLLNAVGSATFARPADTTAYASGDMVANSTTAGSVVPMRASGVSLSGGSASPTVSIRRVRLYKSSTSTTNASFRVHLFTTQPTIASGDNAAFSTSAASDWAGYVDVTMTQAFTDGAAGIGAPDTGIEIIDLVPSGGSLFALIEARGAYTPTSAETFGITVEAVLAD